MAQDLKAEKNQALDISSSISKKRKAIAVPTTSSKSKGKRIRIDSDKTVGSSIPQDIPTGEDTSPEASADDQTAALLKGFESSSESDKSEDDNEGFKHAQLVPAIPKTKDLTSKLKGINDSGDAREESGVVYIGQVRIPHGFYEHEMRAYFSQFGTIQRLRLSRNRRTGHSKHYAFLEFASASVAKIVADTMDSYLMFGHILKCKMVPKEQVHGDLWKGANRRFKHVPRARIEGRKLEAGKGRDSWERKIEVERKRREAKVEKLKAIGYDFSGGNLKGVNQVPIREKVLVKPTEEDGHAEVEPIAPNTDGEMGGITAVESEELETKEPKGKKGEGDLVRNGTLEEQDRPISVGDEKVSKTKAKKRKSKTSGVEEEDVKVNQKEKPKRAKKTKTGISP